METLGDPLTCACGGKELTIHRVKFCAGWEPEHRMVETTLKTNLTNEDVTTMVSQRAMGWKEEARSEPHVKDVTSLVQIAFFCKACKSWASTLNVTERNDDWEHFHVTWEPVAKKTRK